jgi:phosphohistidine phosphatase
MQLYLVQHGEAVPETVDPNRPLTAGGIDDIQRLAAFLDRSHIRVGRIINSGKLRARHSAEIIAGAIAPGISRGVREKGLLPGDSTEWLVDESADWSEDTLIVGHQPFISRFVSRLVLGAETPLLVDVTPGTIVCLVRRRATLAWAIGWVVTPPLLRP